MARESLLMPALHGLRLLPPAQRFGLLVALAAAASIAAAWWMYSQTPDWRVLYSNLSDRDGGSVVAALGQMQVPYKVAEGGGAIMVPAASVHDARLKLASQGLPKGSIVGFELLDAQKLGATQFQEQVAFQRGLEGELARSIQSLASVSAARVHQAVPRSTSFLREAQKPSASVLLNLHPGKSLDRASVAGIVHLVASSVAEMNPRAVSVVDQNGNLLSGAPADGTPGSLDAGQLAWSQQVEAGLARRVEEILEPLLGRANVRAQVTADIDFSVDEVTAESYRPNGVTPEATVRSQVVNETREGGNAAAQGVPGAASNQPNVKAPTATAAARESLRRESTTQYEVDRTVSRVRKPTGMVKRLSAAVVVNHRKSVGPDGKVTHVAIPDDEMKRIEALVKEAMGFNDKRGDTLNVANAAFASEEVPPAVETPLWKDPGNIALAKEAGRALGVAAIALFLLLGVLRPIMRGLAASGRAAAASGVIEVNGAPAALGGPDDPVQAVRSLAKQDPKRVANVVKSWVGAHE